MNTRSIGKDMVPRAGVEPARPFGQRILSPQRLPFRHPGMSSVSRILPSLTVSLKSQSPGCYTSVRKRCWTTLSIFTRFSLYLHQRKTLGLARNSPVRLHWRYGVSSIVYHFSKLFAGELCNLEAAMKQVCHPN